MKRVVHTIGSLASDKGGPSRTVPRLCKELRDEGRWSPILVCTDAQSDEAPPLKGASTGARCTGGGLGFWRQVGRELAADKAGTSIVHDHGLWLANNAMAGLQSLRHGTPLIVSPRGMLQVEALGFRATKKRIALATYQGWLLNRATAFHATSPEEAHGIRRLGLRQPILILPNGVDMPSPGKGLDGPVVQSKRRALFLSRIHPHKGVLELLDAWERLKPAEWRLTLAGPGEPAFREVVAARVSRLVKDLDVELIDAVADDTKWALYADAQLVVLPSRSENFGVVVAEGLASGVPVLTTTGTPWVELPLRDCGWYVKPDVESIGRALAEATSLDRDTLRRMGERGRAWMRQSYGWQGVGRRLADFYDWIACPSPTSETPTDVLVN